MDFYNKTRQSKIVKEDQRRKKRRYEETKKWIIAINQYGTRTYTRTIKKETSVIRKTTRIEKMRF